MSNGAENKTGIAKPADGGSRDTAEGSEPSIAGPAAKSPLVKKLAEVMLEAERVPKRGRNDFHKYDYATESDITGAIREGLASRGLMILPRVTGRTFVEKTNEAGKGTTLAYVDMTFAVMDSESGDVLEFPWLGCGEDKGDKAIYKAFTGALKYFLLKLFLIPTGDDPEREDARKEKGKGKEPAKREDAPGDARELPDGDAGAIIDLAEAISQKEGKTADQIIKAASLFTTEEGKEKFFTDPTSVRSVKWLAGVRRKLEDIHRERVIMGEVDSSEVPF